jgi:hypothetical protein
MQATGIMASNVHPGRMQPTRSLAHGAIDVNQTDMLACARRLMAQVGLRSVPGVVLVAAAASGAGCMTPPVAPPGESSRFVLWDGETRTRFSPKGWASCKERGSCAAAIEVTPGAGRDGGIGLVFRGRGADWIGAGWDWFGFDPSAPGTDVEPFQSLRFWIRVEAGPSDVTSLRREAFVSLSSQTRHRYGPGVPIADFAPDFGDGQWHEVAVPLSELTGGELDAAHVSEIWINTTGEQARSFTIYLDDISLDARPAPPRPPPPPRPDVASLPLLPEYECDRSAPTDSRQDAGVAETVRPQDIERVLRGSNDSVRACYTKRVQLDPGLVGVVGVRFQIDAGGYVANARPVCTSLPSPEVVQCVVAVFRDLRFPPPAAPPLAVVYSINFVPDGQR